MRIPTSPGLTAPPSLSALVRDHGGAVFAVDPRSGAGLVAPDDPRLGVRPGDVHVHSASVERGDVFVALAGLAVDGIRFAPDALQRGAAAVLMTPDRSLEGLRARCAALLPSDAVLWLHPRAREVAGRVASDVHGAPSEALSTAGITGTNGKTSVCHLGSQLLSSAGLSPAVLGTAGHVLRGVDGPLHLVARNTTPDATEVHRLLARHRAAGGDCAVMEVSSHGLMQGRLSGVALRVAAFTNLTREHLDYHGTMGAYLAAKARIWDHVQPGGTAVIVGRSGPSAEMRRRALERGLEVMHVLVDPQADVAGDDLVARGVAFDERGASFELSGAGLARTLVQLPLRGAHNVENALVAAAIALRLGAPAEAVVSGLRGVSAAPGRLEPVDVPAHLEGLEVFVDYAHSPDALERVLGALRAQLEGDPRHAEAAPARGSRRRLICVFGCGGDRDRGKREAMGDAAGRLADVSIVTSDNPRSEDPAVIADAVRRGVERAGGRHFVELDRRAAIGRALELARPGDVVLIAGKGHENTQTIGGASVPFDDRVVAAEALEARTVEAAEAAETARAGGGAR